MAEGFKLGSGFITVRADTDGFKEDLDAKLDKDKTEVTVKVTPDLKDFKTRLDAATKRRNMTVDVNYQSKGGIPGAGGKGINVPIGIDPKSEKTFNDKLNSFAKKGSEIFTPMMGAALGLGPAILPITAGLATGFAPIAAAVGSAAVGLGVFGKVAESVYKPAATAATAVQAAQKTYNQQIQDGTSKSKAYATEQAAISKATQGLTGSQRQLATTIAGMNTAWQGTIRSVTPVVSSALVPWIHDAESAMKALKPLITPIANEIRDLGNSVGTYLKGHSADVKQFASAFGGNSAKMIKDFAQDFVIGFTGVKALLQDIAPNFKNAGDGIHGFVQSFTAWATSSKAADEIRSFFSWVHSNGGTLKGTFDALGKASGNLVKGFAGMSGGSLYVVEQFLNLVAKLSPGEVQALAVSYASLAAAFKLMSVITGAISAITTLTEAMSALKDMEIVTRVQLLALTVAEKAQAVVQGIVKAATAAWTAVQWLLDAAMDANPIGIVVIALAALGAAIYEVVTHWQTILSVTKEVWNTVLNWLKGVWKDIENAAIDTWNFIKQHLSVILPAIALIITGPIGGVVALVAMHWRSILNTTKSVWDSIKNWLGNTWRSIENVAKSVWNALHNWWNSYWRREEQGWKDIWNALKNWLGNTWRSIENVAKSVWNSLHDWWSSFWNRETNGWKNIWNTMKNWLKNLWGKVKDDVVSSWNNIGSWLGGKWNNIIGTLKNVWNNAVSWVRNTLPSAMKSAFERVVDGIGNVWGKLKGIVSKPLSFVVDHVSQGVDGITSKLSMGRPLGGFEHWAFAGGGVVPGYAPGRDTVHAMLSPGEGVLVPEAVKALTPEGVHAINARYSNREPGDGTGRFAGGGIVNDAKNVWSGITGAIKDADNFITNPGSAVKGLINQITGGIPGAQFGVSMATEVAKTISDGLVNWFKKQFAGGDVNYKPGAGVAQWRSDVIKALAMNGLPASFANKVLYQMQTESGGNPNAVNNWDSNAAAGDPSRGLMQVIGSTFAAFHVAGTSGNILNPLANIAAAINYAKHTYGPTLESGGMGMGSGHGYARGGSAYAGDTAWVGEEGPELVRFGAAARVVPHSEAAGGIHFHEGSIVINGKMNGQDVQNLKNQLANALAGFS